MSITLPPEPFEWDDQKGLLEQAALAGSVEFLEECVSRNAPNQYYVGNFLHIAVFEDRTWFVRKVMKLLNPQVIHELMLQQNNRDNYNPLHVAAFKGNVEVVKLFLEFCSLQPSLKPWLQLTSEGATSCHVAVDKCKEECALEILKMDIEELSKVDDNYQNGLLYYAVNKGQWKVALKILESSPSFSCRAPNSSPLQILPRDSDRRDVCRLLLQRAPNLVDDIDNYGRSILNVWAALGKVWPFEYIIQNCDDVIPDIRRRVVKLMSKTTTRYFGYTNPFHNLATDAPNEEDAVKILKILIKTYKQEATQPGHLQPPWLAKSGDGHTVLHHCLDRKFQKLAMHILLEEKDALMEDQGNILVYAIKKGCSDVAKHILNSVDAKEWAELKDLERKNALHVAPYCTKEFLELLVEGNAELVEGIAGFGRTILHTWAEIGYKWPFEYILQEHGINHPQWNTKLLQLLRKQDEFGDNVFHYVVRNKKEKANDILQLLVNAFKELYSTWKTLHKSLVPWFQVNNKRNGALHEAMMNNRQELALNILSLVEDDEYLEVLYYYKPQCNTLFLAMEYNCYQVAQKIVANLKKQDWTPYLNHSCWKNISNGKNILHLATSCTDEEFGKWLVAQAPDEFILEPDKNQKTPLDEASSAGTDWIIRAMLQTNPTSIFNDAPLAWINACQNGHVSAICAFIDCYPGRFKDHCEKYKDSPLHHIKLPNITSYEEFLTIPHMKNLVNFQDSNRKTPLHKAIQDKNIHLAEVLLKVEDILLDIKDNDKQTPRYLLGEICKKDKDWKNMCHDNGFDLSMKLTYLQRRTNSIDTRNTLSVVAALLATITFTAGFTLPGGFNQDTGEAILAKKAAFLVFLISDTIALCTSMLVLTCLIWSMVYDPHKSMFLIDRSMKLLMVSLYSTMVAFVCGVFVVISQKLMWAAILIIVICSLLGLSAKRSILYKIVDKLIPSPNSDCKDRFRQLESGKACCCRGVSSCWKCN